MHKGGQVRGSIIGIFDGGFLKVPNNDGDTFDGDTGADPILQICERAQIHASLSARDDKLNAS